VPVTTGRVTIQVKNSCPLWDKVPIYDGLTLVGNLSMPGEITFETPAGTHQLRSCSPTGPDFMSVNVVAGGAELYATNTAVCPATAPCQ
jgi:hypothetical protein